MKKRGGPRGAARTMSTGGQDQSWRMWVLTTVGLAFAILVITLLSRQNAQLKQMLSAKQAAQETVVATTQE